MSKIFFVEIDWRYVMKRIRILDLWFFRGFFYFYVGFITVQGDSTFTQPQDIIGLAMICMGAFYVLMVRTRSRTIEWTIFVFWCRAFLSHMLYSNPLFHDCFRLIVALVLSLTSIFRQNSVLFYLPPDSFQFSNFSFRFVCFSLSFRVYCVLKALKCNG